MLPDDEPRIKRSIKPEIEERLPPDLDEEHYEIVGRVAPADGAAPGRRSKRHKKSRTYLTPQAYFYVCIALVAVLAVETIALGFFMAANGELQSTNRDLEIDNEDLKSRIKKLTRENKHPSKETPEGKEEPRIIEEPKDTSEDSEGGHNINQLLENFSKRFVVKIYSKPDASGQGKTVLISITIPDETVFEEFTINNEELFIMVTIEGNGSSIVLWERSPVSPGTPLDSERWITLDNPKLVIRIDYRGEQIVVKYNIE